ncbi:nitroreductase/FMN reductase [NAD(P)H] [Humitalea rosea]|uniref:Nitroreductase/FMN reductase [NAD(P)H] n=1 Tax=Humitalea rosea TaxID=990373 RepID=A0A2W7I0K9_9PROT|nr:nitroreductase family protein [Humitalea rosea]PZW39858.1 nitroreductase/FMN reductase [NAD(P)H] [Humitalea rosea]
MTPAGLIAARFGAPAFDPPEAVPEALAAILDRRVTRRFRAEAVPETLLATVLAAAQSAPSKSDLQQYSIIVWQDPRKIAAVADAIGTMPWIKDAPVLLLFCGDMLRGRRACLTHGRSHANDSIDTFLNASADAALAMGFSVMAADALGLGTCPISYVRNHLDLVAGLAALPEGVFPVAGLVLGWPQARNEVTPRLPPAVVVHRETYDDSALPEAFTSYDALRPRQKPRYPNVHGPAPEGCTWSENAARQLSVPERAGFRAWLASKGINLG